MPQFLPGDKIGIEINLGTMSLLKEEGKADEWVNDHKLQHGEV